MISRAKRRRTLEKNQVTLLSLVKDCFMLMTSFLSFEDITRCCRTSVTGKKLFGESLGKTRDVVMTTRNCSGVQRHCRKLKSLEVHQDKAGEGCEPYIADLLKSNKKMEQLAFWETHVSPDIVNALCGLTQLKDFCLMFCFSSVNLAQINLCFLPPNLKNFEIAGCYPLFRGVKSSIEYLRVGCNQAAPKTFISSLKRSFPRLKGLAIAVSQQCVHELTSLKHLTKLEIRFSSLNLSILHIFQNLELLRLSSVKYGNTDDVTKGFPVIGTWCKRLKVVSLGFPFCELGDSAVSFLKACNPRELSVYCKQTKAAVFKIFNANMTMSNLQFLCFGEWDGDLCEVLKFAPNLKAMTEIFQRTSR